MVDLLSPHLKVGITDGCVSLTSRIHKIKITAKVVGGS